MTSPDAARPAARGTPRMLKREPALDGLRGVAIVLLLVYQASLVLAPTAGDPFTITKRPWLPGAFLGIDMFFVLTGFLITVKLMADREDPRKGRLRLVYRDRALRIMPALGLVLIAFVAYVLITDLDTDPMATWLLPVAFFYTNWQMAADGSFTAGLSQMWSLAVAGQFYLVWPLLVIALVNLRRHAAVVVAVLSIAIVAVAVHRALLWDGGAPWQELYVRTDTRADALLVGGLLAYLWMRGYTPKRGLGLIAWACTAGLAFLVWSGFANGEFFYRGGFTLVAVLTAAMILGVVDHDWTMGRGLEFPPLVVAGVASYGLFLWHLPIYTAVARYGTAWSPGARVGVGVAATVAATAISWWLVEKPVQRWRQRVERGGSRSVPTREAQTPPAQRPARPPEPVPSAPEPVAVTQVAAPLEVRSPPPVEVAPVEAERQRHEPAEAAEAGEALEQAVLAEQARRQAVEAAAAAEARHAAALAEAARQEQEARERAERERARAVQAEIERQRIADEQAELARQARIEHERAEALARLAAIEREQIERDAARARADAARIAKFTPPSPTPVSDVVAPDVAFPPTPPRGPRPPARSSGVVPAEQGTGSPAPRPSKMPGRRKRSKKNAEPMRRSGTRAKRTRSPEDDTSPPEIHGIFDQVSLPGTVRKMEPPAPDGEEQPVDPAP